MYVYWVIRYKAIRFSEENNRKTEDVVFRGFAQTEERKNNVKNDK